MSAVYDCSKCGHFIIEYTYTNNGMVGIHEKGCEFNLIPPCSIYQEGGPTYQCGGNTVTPVAKNPEYLDLLDTNNDWKKGAPDEDGWYLMLISYKICGILNNKVETVMKYRYMKIKDGVLQYNHEWLDDVVIIAHWPHKIDPYVVEDYNE